MRLPQGETPSCYFIGPLPFMLVIDIALEEFGVPDEHRHYEPTAALN
ncbi:hypothetical protein [Halomonas shantousis]